MIRKAVILAAGRGTRVQPLTHDMPKPMIPVLGKPVMQYIVEHLARQGIQEIMVNVSHMADRIEQYFGDGSRFGVRIGYSFEGYLQGDRLVPEPVGSGGALRKINDFAGFIDGTTLVVCGDAIVDLDIQAAAHLHRFHRAVATVITHTVAADAVSNYGIVTSRPDGSVAVFQEKPSADQALSRQASTGIYLIDPQALALIPADRPYDIGSELFPELVRKQMRFFHQAHDFTWLDIGRVSDYWRIVQLLMRGEVPGIGIPGLMVRPGVFCGLNARVHWDSIQMDGPVYIGSGACVEPGAILRGPVWVGNGCRVEAGARVEQSVLLDYAQVGPNANAREMIVSGHYCVGRDGQTASLDTQVPWWSDARRRSEHQNHALQ